MGLGIGGAETHIVELAKELRRRGNDVAVASAGGVYVPEIEAAGIRHYCVPMNRRDAGLMARSLLLLDGVIRREKPDVVHAHARIPAFLCGLLKKTRRFPFVTTAHWVFDTGGALRRLTNWGDRTIAVSEDIKKYLMENYGIPEEHIFVTINGIDTEKFSPSVSGTKVRAEFGIAADAPVVAHVSRMDAGRELAARRLIAVAPRLAQRVPGAVVLIAGGGDVLDEFRALAEAANREAGRRCVVMAGPRTDVNEFAAAGDVFVGVSRAALEAMAAGKPAVVAGNEGYLGIFTPDKLGTAVESNFCCRGCPAVSEDALLEDLCRCFAMTGQERRALGEAGRAVVLERYSVGRMADDTLRAYRSALPPKRIVMSGYYGFGNAGDEAILRSLCGSVSRNVPGAEITVLSKKPSLTAGECGCRAVARFDPAGVFGAVRRCDVLISGGGSLLQDSTSTRSLLYYLWIIHMAERLGKKTVIFANGIGPVTKPRNRERVRRTVERADVVTLRDPDSARELREMGVCREDVTVEADPVFLLEPAPAARAEEILRASGLPEGASFAAVSVRPWNGGGGFPERFAALCDMVRREYGREIVFVAMQPASDGKASLSVMGRMKNRAYLVSGGCTPGELMAVFGKADAVISMRLHSLIFAARMGTPAVGFVYDPKVESYLDMLGMPSAGSPCGCADGSAERAVRDLLENREAHAARIREKYEALRKAAEENEKLLIRVLE